MAVLSSIITTFNQFMSITWWLILGVFVLGAGVIALVSILMFYSIYNRKVELFDNISGGGYQKVLSTRARVIKINGVEELLKPLRGGLFLTATGRKVGRNTYWFFKGEDGYYYNAIPTDLDTKKGLIDVEPTERDVRMFHVAIDRMAEKTYDSESWLSKHSTHLLLFLFLICLIVGMWVIVGKIGSAISPLTQSQKITTETMKTAQDTMEEIRRTTFILERLVIALTKLNESISYTPIEMNLNSTSGLVQA